MRFSLHSIVFFFKQKTAYEMRISDWSSDVCSSDLCATCATSNTATGTAKAIDTALHRSTRGCREGSGPSFLNLRRSDSDAQRYCVGLSPMREKIGRASCRDRGCQSV